MSFVLELKVGKQKPHRIIFAGRRGRRELRAVGGTLVGYAILDQVGLKIEFVEKAAEKLVEGYS